jgi:hypothetical protein
MTNNKKLVLYLLKNTKTESWLQLAEKFNIKHNSSDRKRQKAANDIWRTFIRKIKRNNTTLDTVKEVYNKDGILIFETKKILPKTKKFNKNNLNITKITTNPYGGQWITYEQKPNEETELFLEGIKDIILKDVETFDSEIPLDENNNKSLLVYTSDKHIGAETSTDSIYENKYNLAIFTDRLTLLMQNIKKQSQIFGVFKNLVIFDLGDAVDGYNNQTTRGGHHLPQNMDNKSQFLGYFEAHRRFFASLIASGVAHNISFVGMANSNHGGDIDFMAMKTLEIWLNAKFPKIDTYISGKFIDHIKIDNHTIMYSHGKDKVDRNRGLPLNLDPKSEVFINDYIEYYNLTNNIHFIKGDLHQSNKNTAKKFRYRNVMSMYGSSSWSHHNFGNGKSGVSMDVVDGNSNQIYETDLIF